jgi:hypothetical protein
MEFTADAQLRQGSHLFVNIAGRAVCLLHVVADYEGGGSFSNEAVFPLPQNFSLDVFDDFIQGILISWQKELDWEFIDCDTGVCVTMEGDDKGLDGTTLTVSPEYFVEDFHSTILGTEATLFDNSVRINGMASYFNSLGASELINVNIDWDGITVLALTDNPAVSPGNVCVKEFSIEHSEDFSNLHSMLSKILCTRISKQDVNQDFANIFHKKLIRSTSTKLWDLVRSYITIKLFELEDRFFQNFGFEGKDPHLMIGGDFVKLIPASYAFLSVIDGLQLRGRYKVSIDNSMRFVAGVVTQGDNRFICPFREIYPGNYIYLSTEKGGSGKKGKTSFQGKLKFDETPEDDSAELLLGQVGGMFTFETPGRGSFYLKPDRDVYFPNLEREDDFLKGGFKEENHKLVIDCRVIPVVYGPDVEANLERVPEWLQGIDIK